MQDLKLHQETLKGLLAQEKRLVKSIKELRTQGIEPKTELEELEPLRVVIARAKAMCNPSIVFIGQRLRLQGRWHEVVMISPFGLLCHDVEKGYTVQITMSDLAKAAASP